MSLVDITPLIWPWWNPNAATFPALGAAVTLDAAADRVGVVFAAPKTGDLDRMEFSLTATPTGTGNLKVGWQGVSLTTGYHDGTFTHWSDFAVFSSGWTATSGYFGASGKDSGAKKSVTAGDLVAFIMSTENMGGTISIAVRHFDLGTSIHNMCSWPRGVQNLTAANAVNNDALGCALFYDGETDPVPFSAGVFFPFNGNGTVSVSTAGARIVGNLFEVPFKCRAVGAYLTADLDADVTLRLYDSDGTTDLLGGACVIDKDLPGVPTTAQAMQWMFPSTVVLDADTPYRLAIENTTATAVAAAYVSIGRDPGLGIDYGTATPGGAEFDLTQASVAHGSLTLGSWAESTTQRILMSLIIDQIDDGVSGYGGGFNAAWARGANSVVAPVSVQ